MLAAGLVVVGASGCGSAGRSPSAPAQSEQVGADVHLATTTSVPPTTAAPTTVAARAAAPLAVRTTTTTPVPFCQGRPATPGGPVNARSRTDASGLKVTIVVDKLCFDASEPIQFEVDIDNVSNKPLQYDSSRYVTVRVVPSSGAAAPSWTDMDCKGPGAAGAPPPPALTIDPGEHVVFQTPTYRRDARCQVLTDGRYTVRGFVRWCQAVRSDGSCDPARTADLPSDPIEIQLG